jgi:hypothetical protein|tara:strand:+ start:640 stop:804 length:165 start_codon:yes stop_codon:yes gene_type:complete
MIKSWITNRIAQRSSIDGVAMAATGAGILIFSPFAHIIAYAAIVYGIYTMWRKG